MGETLTPRQIGGKPRYFYGFVGRSGRIENEVVANRLYEAAGVKVPKVQKSTDGRVASKIETSLQDIPRDNVPSIKGVADGFATDAWLANWDAVGLSYDNIKSRGGQAMRIDAGGALRYRAMGAPKGAAFGKKVGEVTTLRSRSVARTPRRRT